MRLLISSLAFVSMGLIALPSSGQVSTMPLLEREIILDGIVTDEEWNAVEPLPLTMYQPTFEGTMTESTEIRVGHDANYIYVAGKLFDSEPDGIRANTLYRDRYSGDDTFAIILDTFNDDENAVWFFTTPAGVRFDMAVSNDANFSGGQPMNSSWNTFWDVQTAFTSFGWSVEMRIPFSSLGFQVVDGTVEMGMIVYRYIARKNERHIYPAIPPNWGMGFAKPSVARNVRFEGIQSKRPVYITPYILGGRNVENELNELETEYSRERDVTREAGLDLRYNITNNLSLDLTANTDFAQVEADDQQVNLSRFSLFFPEKRQFFQQRSGVFNYNTGGSDRLFHSRRIGLSDGEPVRLLGGSRVVGRIGSWDVGFIDMQTDKSSDLPSENFGVLRIRRNVLNQNSYAGAMVTSRLSTDGDYNIAYGLDTVLRIRDEDYATLQLSQVFDDGFAEDGNQTFRETSLLRAVYERRAQEGVVYSAAVSRVGEFHEPGIGFRARDGYLSPSVSTGYGWFGSETSLFRSVEPEISGNVFFRLDDKSIESAELQSSVGIEFKSGSEVNADISYRFEALSDTLSFSSRAEVLPGTYDFINGSVRYDMHDGNLFRASFGSEAGSFFDGYRYSISVSPTWSMSKHVEMGADVIANFIRFGNRNQQFDFQLIRARTQLALNRKISANAFVQVNTANKFVSANARFRYNISEGNDLWIVYNEGIHYDRMRELPFLPAFRSRTILLKFTYTFIS
ncbi:MAG: carbohydrate binding family 9 domain-containing protein [Rhodothermales bacterium]|nr:carbohydrate binding family 9 domain-containing protein [Rhodothermales bacterium]